MNNPPMWAMFAVAFAAALFCRYAGYLAMRYLPPSHRLDAALKATPLAVMAGITAMALAAGGLTEALALATAIAVTIISRNDVVAAVLGVAVAALLRYFGG